MEEEKSYEVVQEEDNADDNFDYGTLMDKMRTCDPIVIDQFELSNTIEFKEGVRAGAKWAGMMSVLMSNGFSFEEAIIVITNAQTLEGNLKMTKANSITTKKNSPLA